MLFRLVPFLANNKILPQKFFFSYTKYKKFVAKKLFCRKNGFQPKMVPIETASRGGHFKTKMSQIGQEITEIWAYPDWGGD